MSLTSPTAEEPGNYTVLGGYAGAWNNIGILFIEVEEEKGCWVDVSGLCTPLILPPFIQIGPHHIGLMVYPSSFWKFF